MAHCLNLYIPDSIDCRVQEVVDISIYDPTMAIEEPTLIINIPEVCDCDYQSIIKVKGTTYLTSNTFGYTDTCATGLLNLPDGIYTYNYSVCPNDEVYVEMKVLRDCITRCKIWATISNISIDDCNTIFDCYGTDVKSKALMELKDMLLILDTAKVDVEQLKFDQAEAKLATVNSRLTSFNF